MRTHLADAEREGKKIIFSLLNHRVCIVLTLRLLQRVNNYPTCDVLTTFAGGCVGNVDRSFARADMFYGIRAFGHALCPRHTQAGIRATRLSMLDHWNQFDQTKD